MKLTLRADIDELRARAIICVEAHFNGIAVQHTHRDLVHALKRQMAQDVIAGKQPNALIVDEASEAGVDPTAYAALIVNKPDELAERERLRRQLKARIRSGTVQDIREIMSQYSGGMPNG